MHRMNTLNWILLYLDPGTGSLLIQFLIAGITGILIFIKQVKLLIKDLFHRLFNKKEDTE